MRTETLATLARMTENLPSLATLAGEPIPGAEPNMWFLMALLYLALGVMVAAGTLVAGGNWHGCSPERRAWAGRHQAHGMTFAALFMLLGLVLLAVAHLRTVGMGPTVVLLLGGIVVLLTAYALSGGVFEGDASPDQAAAASEPVRASTYTAEPTLVSAAPQHRIANAGAGIGAGDRYAPASAPTLALCWL
ncbi:MAG: hypothetical protein AAFR04_05225 [Pseudomonadota bacterium]